MGKDTWADLYIYPRISPRCSSSFLTITTTNKPIHRSTKQYPTQKYNELQIPKSPSFQTQNHLLNHLSSDSSIDMSYERSEAKIEMWRCCRCKFDDQDVADPATEECENCPHRRCGGCVTLYKPVRTRSWDLWEDHTQDSWDGW